MSILRAILKHWALLAASFVAAAIVHLWLTLSAMDREVMPGYEALVASLPVNEITYLDAVTPRSQSLPFMMPDALYAICHFDAAQSSIQLTATLPDVGWSLSLHAPNGDNFYFVPGTPRRVTKLDLILQTSGSAFLTAPFANTRRGIERPRIILPGPNGIAVLRAPIKGRSYRRQADLARGAFTCRSLPNAVASR